MKKVIIDGVEYRAVTPEVKEETPERLVFFIRSIGNYFYADLEVDRDKDRKYLCKAVELRENEIIVSEDDVRNAWRGCIRPKDGGHYAEFLKLLGFKKDGV